jgi:hypothetical protein
LIRVGAEASGSTSEEFAAFLQMETQRWKKVLRQGAALSKG